MFVIFIDVKPRTETQDSISETGNERDKRQPSFGEWYWITLCVHWKLSSSKKPSTSLEETFQFLEEAFQFWKKPSSYRKKTSALRRSRSANTNQKGV